jgi:hypothetical protein
MVAVSSKYGFWNEYKTDILADRLSLTSDGESLIAIGSTSYISKYSESNKLVRFNGFTMKPNSTIQVLKSQDYNCFIVINENAKPTIEVEKGLRYTDIWVNDCNEEIIFPEDDINVHLPAEPSDQFKCNVTVILCEYGGIVTLKGSGSTINNVEDAIIPSFKYEGDQIFKSYDDETWVGVETDTYDEFVRVDEMALAHGKTYKFIYIKDKSGWYAY